MKLTKAQKRRLVAALSALLLVLAGILSEHYGWNFPGQNQAQVIDQKIAAGMYKVVEFDDGDTIKVDMDGTTETIRFIGVDTPETKDPRKTVQCFGHAASEFTKQLIGDNPVRLEADPENTNRDRYNRLLRYIYLPDNTLVNAEIIKQGYGFAYTGFPFSKIDEFRQYQKDAQAQNRGLWSSCNPTINDYGGFTSNPEST